MAGEGVQFSIDRDFDGTVNGAELIPKPAITSQTGAVRVSWPLSSPGWLLESSETLHAPWAPVTHPRALSGATQFIDETMPAPSARFYRLHRTW
jgi:hypothetical protein